MLFIHFRGESAEENDGNIRSDGHHFVCQPISRHVWHTSVADHQIELVEAGPKSLQGFQAAGIGGDPISQSFEHHLLHADDRRLIIDQKNPFRSLGEIFDGSRAGFAVFFQQRQIDMENGAFADFAVHPDISAIFLDDAMNHRKPQSGTLPLFLGGEIRLENFRNG